MANSKQTGWFESNKNQIAAVMLLPFSIMVESYYIGTMAIMAGVLMVGVVYLAAFLFQKEIKSITGEAARIVLGLFLILILTTRTIVGPVLACVLVLVGVLGCHCTFRLWRGW